jgi:membrane dipeptidase
MTHAALAYTDHSKDLDAWAAELGISREAIEIYARSDVIDLHIDSFIWTRVFGYDLLKKHGPGPTRGWLFSQLDLPRVREARLSGGIWSITTNPVRERNERSDVFADNLDSLRDVLARAPKDVAIVRNLAEYRAARAKGLHAAFVGVQGGNAVDRHIMDTDALTEWIIRVTLVHLSTSTLGTTSSPLAVLGSRGDLGLTTFGKEYVERLNAARILVDLAHISRRGFFDAVQAHDSSQPLIVTHTGVSGAHAHWRNLDDEQLRAIAHSGGTIGVMYHSSFLGDGWFSGRAESVVRHLAHVIETVGEDFASLGSDWDGAIIPPRDLRTVLDTPRLVQRMLDRRWTPERIQKILGGNFLRVLAQLRP